ncbi:MAG: threonine synthase [Oscillospiraceae bacterium]|nr:threonine synthase [Oscillospiraceae bacterium]
MNYTSTRNNSLSVSSSFAIANGISEEGGLFVPENIPQVSSEFINSLVPLSYKQRADKILPLFLSDYGEDEIKGCTLAAYGDNFEGETPAPVKKLYDNVSVLELWHGPTCAFKDMALQLLPYLLTGAAKRELGGKKSVILVATSGDTGKAALEGFKDVEGTKILVFYPDKGVSPMQKLQMTTQEGKNVGVSAIEGNFDDAQTGVKEIFTSPEVKAKLEENNMSFSSANSINWGRLVPQIVYYFSAYADLIQQGVIKNGDKVNFTVPTGNFGNILAAYYALKMGLPVNRLICASNENDVLTEFLTTGRYNRLRKFHTTVSPSMDILISSNLERLIFHMLDGNSDETKRLFDSLSVNGEYSVSEQLLNEIKGVFAAGNCDDAETLNVIAKTYKENGYLSDTHTGVAIKVYNAYREETGDKTPAVIVSTASPYKFSNAVLRALSDGESSSLNEFEMVEKLQEITGIPAPAPLGSLKGKAPRFTGVCKKEEMEREVYRLLEIKN